jgi:ABC-2 type transport system ATP-binding protein
MIEVRQLSRDYGRHRAVHGISFTVHPHEVVGFLGPNGAGKSTTLRILSGFLAPSSGHASVAGKNVITDNLAARRNIGYLPEDNPLYEEMCPSEYLTWLGNVRGLTGKLLSQRARRVVDSCGLGDLLSRPIGLLSKGQRQRVGLAAAILHEPKVLLLDEPTSGLDPHQAAEVRDLIADLKKDKTVLLSTHILSEVEASCDRVVILNKGTIAAEGVPAELAAQSGNAGLQCVFQTGPKPTDIQQALEVLPGISQVRIDIMTDEIRADLETDSKTDVRADVFRLAVEKKWTLLGLHVRSTSLEQVFRSLAPQASEGDSK